MCTCHRLFSSPPSIRSNYFPPVVPIVAPFFNFLLFRYTNLKVISGDLGCAAEPQPLRRLIFTKSQLNRIMRWSYCHVSFRGVAVVQGRTHICLPTSRIVYDGVYILLCRIEWKGHPKNALSKRSDRSSERSRRRSGIRRSRRERWRTPKNKKNEEEEKEGESQKETHHRWKKRRRKKLRHRWFPRHCGYWFSRHWWMPSMSIR